MRKSGLVLSDIFDCLEQLAEHSLAENLSHLICTLIFAPGIKLVSACFVAEFLQILFSDQIQKDAKCIML